MCTASRRTEMGHAAASHEIRNTVTASLLQAVANCPQQQLQDKHEGSRHACMSMVQQLLSFSEGSEPQQLVLCCPYKPFTESAILVLYGYSRLLRYSTQTSSPVCLQCLNLQCNIERSVSETVSIFTWTTAVVVFICM